jgi:hypothetical protein
VFTVAEDKGHIGLRSGRLDGFLQGADYIKAYTVSLKTPEGASLIPHPSPIVNCALCIVN